MKKLLSTAVLLFSVFLFSQAQNKRALIIAIGDYPDPEENGWRAINALNDVPLIENALLKQNFQKGNISIITDSAATKKGIDKALDKLIQSSDPGDVVVIHISSHGQQIEDDNEAEETDGLDECIVPYGAVYSIDKSVFGKVASGYYRDDSFGEKITQLRNKLGKNGDVLVSIDACHSGSGTRGNVAIARGNNSPMVSDNFAKKKMPAKDAAGVFKESTRTKLSNAAASYVVISGAQAQELNFECLDDQNRPVGSLSYAFSKAITTLEGKITYRGLFAQIEEVMREKAPKQKPVLEGDGIDRELFGGKYLRQQPYITINATQSDSRSVALNGGTVSGATVGSTVSFYPTGTTSTATGSWIGVVSSDWNTAGNWCGGIPGTTTDVFIPASAPNMPNLSGGSGSARQITIGTGATLTVGAGGLLNIYGDLVNNGIFNALGGSLAFRGTNLQSIAGFIALNATMNGTGGVALAGNSAVTGTLTLTNGNITLGSSDLALSASATGSTGSHIITNGSGNVVVMFLAASTSRTVPVGSDAVSYNPLTISANAGHTTDHFMVNCKTGVPINGIASPFFTSDVVNRTWLISEGVAGGSNVNLSFQWAGSQELTGFQRNRSYVIRHNGATWLSGPAAGAGGIDPYTQTITGVSSFSPFAVRSELLPRPRTGIYPNPARNQLNVILDMSADTPATFTVYDSKGRQMIQLSTTLITGLSRTTLNLDKLASGVYVLKVSTSANPELLVERFVKQR